MNVVAARSSGLALATLIATTVALAGTLVAAALHAQIWLSTWLEALMAVSFVASIVGAIGGLLMASRRRNVMWILAVSVSAAALMVLLAVVASSFGPD